MNQSPDDATKGAEQPTAEMAGQAEAETRSCCLCGVGTFADAVEVAEVASNVRKFGRQQFTVWRCRACSSLHAKEAVDYAEAYAGYPLQKQKLDFFARRLFASRLRQYVAAGLRRDHVILDYGCGLGHFVSYLKARGFSRVHGYDTYVAAYADTTILEQRFDFVFAQDVIEHVPDPVMLLRQWRDLLTADGRLAIGTPDASRLDLADEADRLWALHQPFHRHILARECLIDLLVREGFTPLTVLTRYYADTLFPGVNIAFLTEYMKQVGAGKLDVNFETPQIGKVLASPKMLFLMLFGYFLAGRKDLQVFAKRRVP